MRRSCFEWSFKALAKSSSRTHWRLVRASSTTTAMPRLSPREVLGWLSPFMEMSS
uniref:Uncharacterized protein n=1 Tax=Arundo donax TaxID=35708 RepID=A0A0A9GB99_ARUDO